MDITTATPVEIDTELARIGGEIAQQEAIISRAERTIDLEHKHPAPSGDVNQRRIDQCQGLINAALIERARLRGQAAPFEAEFARRGGWTRYFLVDSETGNGHVHSDASTRRCSRVAATRHYWLTDQSGRPAVDVVADAGERACTVCFPWAPVETLSRPTMFYTPTEQEKQVARAERERKAEAKRAKAITNPDGSVLRYGHHEQRIETVVGAQRALVDIVFIAAWYRSGQQLSIAELADVERIATALAHKLGTSPAAELVAANDRYVAKCKREGVTP
jgi:hypothetical protein